RADEDAGRRFGKLANAKLTLFRWEQAGYGDDSNLAAEPLAKLLGQVLGGWDEPAEDDGVVAVPDEIFQQGHGLDQLGVLVACKLLRLSSQFQKPAGTVAGRGFFAGVAAGNNVGGLGCFV